jgi:hypothetical protein
VVEGGGLENRCVARHPGFESLLLRRLWPRLRGGGRVGRRRTPAKRVYRTVSRVRIPPSPRTFENLFINAPVAQLDRASVYGTEGQVFESPQARQVLWFFPFSLVSTLGLAKRVPRLYRISRNAQFVKAICVSNVQEKLLQGERLLNRGDEIR